jgi:hypothetical protein
MCLPGVSFVSQDMPTPLPHPTDSPEITDASNLLYSLRHIPAVIPVFLRPDPPIKAFSHNNAKIDGHPDWEDYKGYDCIPPCFMSPNRWSHDMLKLKGLDRQHKLLRKKQWKLTGSNMKVMEVMDGVVPIPSSLL